MEEMDYSFEPLGARHREPVIDIFNHYIRNSHAAFPGAPVDYRFFDRFLEVSRGYPAVAVKTGSGQVVGFGFLRPHHPADSFRRTAEVTYFILPEHCGRGLGTAMLEMFVERAGRLGIDSILASVSSRNEASLRFHRKHGFRECGRFPRVGRKLGEDFDVIWLQKRIGGDAAPGEEWPE
jgi:L-amino acid N-acyltransferase YncA